MDLYIYYRVRVDHAAAVQAGVAALQQKMRRDDTAPDGGQLHRGLRCGLKRRPEPVDGRHTWMEIYLDVPAGFEARLEAAWLRSGMPPLIDGERHTEYFLDCLPCA